MKVFTLYRGSLAIVFLILLVLFLPQNTFPSDPDTIMARHIRAIGGRGKIKYLRDFTIKGHGDVYGVPSDITITGIYPDYYEECIKNGLFEIVWFRSPAGEFLKTIDGSVRKLTGLDREGFYARSYIFNYAYITDMSLPLIPEMEVDPTVFTMDTGANFGTVITLDPETYLIDTISMETGSGTLDIAFFEHTAMGGITFPKRIGFYDETHRELFVDELAIDTGLATAGFTPPVEDREVAPCIGADAIDIPMSMDSGYVTLGASVDGKKTTFVLDSAWGGPPVLKGRACAGTIGGVDYADFIYRGGSFDTSISIGKNSEIAFESSSPFGRSDECSLRSVVFVSSDLDGIKDTDKIGDGILGHTFFSSFPVGIDIARGKLEIYNRDSFAPPENAKKIRLTIDGGRPLIAGRFNGEYGMWVIDTAYPGYGYVPITEDKMVGSDGETAPGGASEKTTGPCVVDSINVGGIVFKNPDLIYDDPPPSYPSLILGVLGTEFLKNFTIIFDYGQGIAYIVFDDQGEEP
jgi:hypothetical protein